MEAPTVLLLDEPTNDLDLETMAVLESFIDDFNGAIIFVSHDRFFVDRLADKCFVYDPGGALRLYPGGYSYYKQKAAEEQAAGAASETKTAPAPKASAPAAKDAGEPEKPARPKKLTFKEQKEYAEIEDVIASKEGELKATELLMQQNAADYGKLAELSKEQQRLQAELDHLMERWAYLEEVAESSI